MFSSKELISFVFANEDDIYYGDDLIKRDLSQYLWDQLHQNYAAVYFLNAKANGFAVHTYGDRRCKEYIPKKKTLLASFTRNDFGGWLKQRLQAKSSEAAAFVCPLEDFCAVLDDRHWDTMLAEIAELKNRTGIFVLTASATAEKSTRLLLDSPVFEKLHESAVTDLRGAARQSLYGTLQNRKGYNCVFLNGFSRERLRAMLIHLVIEHPNRLENNHQLHEWTQYLYTCCQQPEFTRVDEIFYRDMPVQYFLYKDLYTQLCSDETWQQFTAACDHFQKQELFGSFVISNADRVPVLRDRSSYTGRCLRIKLPLWLTETEETKEEATRLLREIQDAVSVPLNRKENQDIMADTETLLNQLPAIYSGNFDMYVQVLRALKFCVTNIYAQTEKEVERVREIIRTQKQLISICHEHFTLKHGLHNYLRAESRLHKATLLQKEKECSTLEQLKQKYLDLVSAMELDLKTPEFSENITQMLDSLQQEIQKFAQPTEDSNIVEKLPDAPAPEKAEKEIYVPTSGFYRLRPSAIEELI